MADTIFFCPDILQNPQLPAPESQHCVKVLRMKEGDQLVVTDGNGSFFHCTLVQTHPKHCLVSIQSEVKQEKSWDFKIHIAFAPTKSMDRNEWFTEKATEIGIDRFTPLLCRYSERKELKHERLQKIIVSAMKQSQQAFLPALDEMTRFEEFVMQSFEGQKFIAHCHPSEKNSLAKTYQKTKNALILIGPDGDFSEEEVQQAIHRGFTPISLGENRLRTETACVAACHTIHVINQL